MATMIVAFIRYVLIELNNYCLVHTDNKRNRKLLKEIVYKTYINFPKVQRKFLYYKEFIPQNIVHYLTDFQTDFSNNFYRFQQLYVLW